MGGCAWSRTEARRRRPDSPSSPRRGVHDPRHLARDGAARPRAATTSSSTACTSRPSARASVSAGPPVADGPLYAFPLFGLLAVAIASVCLGIARGALGDLTALAGAKVPAGGRRTLAERATVQAEVARAEAAVRAARALLDEAVGEAWDAAGRRRAACPSAARRPPARRLARRPRGVQATDGRVPAGRRRRAVRVEPAAAAAARRPGRRAAHARRARDVGADRPAAARAADRRHAALIRPISCAPVIEDDLDWPEDPKLIALLGEDGAAQFRSWLDNFPDSVGILWAIRDGDGRIVDFSFGYGNPAILRAFSLPASSADKYTLLRGAAAAGRPPVIRGLRPRVRHGRAVGARGHVRHAVRRRLHARHVHRALRAARRRADQLPHRRHRAAADGARAAQLRRRRRPRPQRADRGHRDARRAARAAPGAAAARRRAAPAADEHGPGAGDDRGRARVRAGRGADHASRSRSGR